VQGLLPEREFSGDCVNRSVRDNEERTRIEPNEMTNKEPKQERGKSAMPGGEQIQAELSSATSIDDFFGREGIFARLFSKTLEQMLEAELTAHLGYEKHEAKGRNSGNSRNGKYRRSVRSSGGGKSEIAVPREVCDDVPFAMVSSSRKSCTNMKRLATRWKIKA
jgi:hypothetical protein